MLVWINLKGGVMKALMAMVESVYELGFSEEIVCFLLKNREFVLEAWVKSNVSIDIMEHLCIDETVFRSQIAEPVYDYFQTILLKENTTGNCPAMRSLVDRFYVAGLNVEEVFINCTTFKNTIMRLFDDRKAMELYEEKHRLLVILDYNLYGILSIYSNVIVKLNHELADRNNIIEENVLYTRTDKNGIIVETTQAFCDLCGYTKEELIGHTHALLRHPDIDDSLYRNMWENIISGHEWYGELPNLRKDGTTFVTSIKILPIFDDVGEVIEYMAIRHDITSDRLAQRDPLTGLYNRREFDKKFIALFTDSIINNDPLCVIIGDIDHFKHINDQYGHTKGDEVLKKIAELLVENTRTNDICARWGGEEFVIVLPLTQIESSIEIAERVRKAIETTVALEGITVTCSFGIAQKHEGETIKSLFERADQMLYRAKKRGRNQTIFDI